MSDPCGYDNMKPLILAAYIVQAETVSQTSRGTRLSVDEMVRVIGEGKKLALLYDMAYSEIRYAKMERK